MAPITMFTRIAVIVKRETHLVLPLAEGLSRRVHHFEKLPGGRALPAKITASVIFPNIIAAAPLWLQMPGVSVFLGFLREPDIKLIV